MVNMKISRKLLPIKAHYFFFNAGTAPLMPFLPVFAKQLGVSQVGVGIMYTILPFIGLVSKPLFGFLSDKFKIGKILFLLTITFTGLLFSAICLIPGQPMEAYLNLDCSSSATVLKTCENIDSCTLDKIGLGGSDNDIMNCTLSCAPDSTFVDDMCSGYNISDWCLKNMKDETLLDFRTHSNISSAILDKKQSDQACLFFSVESLTFLEDDVRHPVCRNSTSMRCKVDCDSSAVMSFIQRPVSEYNQVPYYSTIQFQLLFGLMIASWMCMSVVVSLSDSICFTLLGNKPHNYGAQRLWGALGWGIAAIISGYLIDVASAGKSVKDYTPSLYLIIIFLVINVLFVSKLQVDHHETPMVFKKVLILFKDVKFVLFLSSVICFGVCIGIIWQFLFWYLEVLAASQGCDSLHWIKLLEGLAMGIQCFAGEAPFLFLSGWFLKRLGHVHTMTMILIAMGLRLLAYSFLTNPWYVLPVELLNGVTLGVYWSTSASYAYLVAPPGTASTLQGVFGAVFEGIGTSIGSLLGGYIFQNYDGVVLFRSFAIFSLTAGVLFSLANLVVDKIAPRKDTVADVVEYSSEEDTYNRVAFGPKAEDN